MADWKDAVVRVYEGGRNNGGKYRGSAFMISNHWLLTCWHVVRGAKQEEICLYDANAWDGGVRQIRNIFSDEKIDVALLELRNPMERPNLVPVCIDPVSLKGMEVDCAGFSSETGDRDTFRMQWQSFEGSCNLHVFHGKAGKGMSGSPAMHCGKLVGILRLQNDKTYAVPVGDFLELLRTHDALPSERTASLLADYLGTKIPYNEFDKVIQKSLNDLFSSKLIGGVATRIFELAKKHPDKMSIGELLCSPDVEIEIAIGWLIHAIIDVMKAMPCEEQDSFKENCQKIFEWMILRTVDPEWTKQHQNSILREEQTRMEVFMDSEHALGVAVIFARCCKRPASFRCDESGALRGEGELSLPKIESGIEPAANEEDLIRIIYKKIFSKDIRGDVAKEHRIELSRRLKNRLMAGIPYYLAINSEGQESAFRAIDIQRFHEQFPFLRLIVLRMPDGSKSALMIKAEELDDFIRIFFEDAIGMSNRSK